MAKVTAEVTVDANVVRALSTDLGIKIFTYAVAIETAEVMIKNISNINGNGRLYKINGRDHFASSPDQFPTVESGELKKSIDVTLTGANPEADLIIESDYALDLEFGTSRMRNRPFIIRSINEAMSTKLPKIFDRFNNILENGRAVKLVLLTMYATKYKNMTAQGSANWNKRRGIRF